MPRSTDPARNVDNSLTEYAAEFATVRRSLVSDTDSLKLICRARRQADLCRRITRARMLAATALAELEAIANIAARRA